MPKKRYQGKFSKPPSTAPSSIQPRSCNRGGNSSIEDLTDRCHLLGSDISFRSPRILQRRQGPTEKVGECAP